MEYRIIVTKELPVKGGEINDLIIYHEQELKVVYSSMENALRAANRVIAFNLGNSNLNIYVSVVTFYQCGCIQKIIDVIFLRNLIQNTETCTGENTPSTLVDTQWILTGNEATSLVVDNDIPNNDSYQISIVSNPLYGDVFIKDYTIHYTSINTNSTLTDSIIYKVTNTITGCFVNGTINININ